MPAIQPARLRHQAALLAEHFNEPQAFVRSMHHLMEFYSERARRPGVSGKPDPLVLSYKVRPPVLRLLLRELIPLAERNPQQGLALCDKLWDEPYLEFRTLACMLLGQISPEQGDAILERLQTWITPELENYLIDTLLTHGLQRLRRENGDAVRKTVEEWLRDNGTFRQQLGLRALLTLIEDPDFENIPAFFNLIQPLARKVPPPLRSDLLDVVIAMARRSPQEATYFLRHTLQMAGAVDTPWLIRQSMSVLPPDLQESMHQSLHNQSN
jgi:hypothetical protein